MITDYLRKNSGSAWFSGIIAMDNERLASIVHADECIAIGGRQRRAVIQVPQPFSGGGSAHTVVRSLIVGSKWVRVRVRRVHIHSTKVRARIHFSYTSILAFATVCDACTPFRI